MCVITCIIFLCYDNYMVYIRKANSCIFMVQVGSAGGDVLYSFKPNTSMSVIILAVMNKTRGTLSCGHQNQDSNLKQAALKRYVILI